MSKITLPAIIIFAAACVILGSYYFGNVPQVSADSMIVSQMNDTTTTFGLSTFSGRPIQAEYASSTSSLVGKSIDTITVKLRDSGLPNGTIQVGVFNSNLSVKQLFGTIDASTLTKSYVQHSFSLPLPQTYQIQAGDRIGIKFDGGDSSNYVNIMTDQKNTFDGANSYLVYYTTSWRALQDKDLSLVLGLHVPPPTVSASPAAGTYNHTQSVALAASRPSTIFYTTDGSTPTTSSANGTSPVSGIIINTNSTLQFFAKDNLGNTSPVESAVYTILQHLTASASPPGGTYSSAQSVTLAASRPSTIFYTTDGSTPTTSSAKGPSPLSVIVNSNSTLRFFAKDNFGNTSPTDSASYKIIYPVVIQMSDTVSSTGSSTFPARPLQAEYVSSSSSLVGKSIDTITVKLRKNESPSGTIQIGVFNSDLSVKQLFGTIGASKVTPEYSSYSFSLPLSQTYQIQSGDRIGIKFAGGDSSNYVNIMTDTTNSFGNTNSYLTWYETYSWQPYTKNDLTMTLKSHVYSGLAIFPTPPAGIYNSTQSVTLAASKPSTIFYTTDGSTPTTSSPSGPSPITGITISTNSTIKFFAKDSQANVGPVGSASYAIVAPPTVSASPVAGTYNHTQSVTLSASSKPSTIFYTTDGSSPTTSSAKGPSPLSVTIDTNSTLKFFAKDSLGNTSPTVTGVYTIIIPLKVTSTPAAGMYSSAQSVTLVTSKPSTIFYTTDGSAPTISSAKGPSPVTGITVSTNSTLKFFAKDSLGNTGPVGSSAYTIVVPPTVSASPPGGTYNSVQSITLAASKPSTIFYTYDGSAPTTSSPSGPSPITGITISTNSTLQFFAKDRLGNTGPTGSAVYTIHVHQFLDRFGIKEIHPTVTGGIQWTSNFDNGIARSFKAADHKEGDPWLDVNHNDATFFIDGKGKMIAKGSPRIYVHNPNGVSEWKENLEITFYHIRINETQIVSYSGTQIFAHTNHGVGYDESTTLCPDRGYGAKPNMAGQWAFEKETAHHKSNGYADSYVIPGGSVQFFKNGMPKNTPIGVKYIIYQLPGNQMKLELWADLTDGANGGDWKKVAQATDTGKNWGVGYDACKSGVDPAKVLTKILTQPDSPNIPVDVSVYFRHEYAAMAYEKMSIREIDPSITN